MSPLRSVVLFNSTEMLRLPVTRVTAGRIIWPASDFNLNRPIYSPDWRKCGGCWEHWCLSQRPQVTTPPPPPNNGRPSTTRPDLFLDAFKQPPQPWIEAQKQTSPCLRHIYPDVLAPFAFLCLFSFYLRFFNCCFCFLHKSQLSSLRKSLP